MEDFALVIGFILGVPAAFGMALLICSSILNKSNNFGDSKGDLMAFSTSGIQGRNYRDRISRNTNLDPVVNPTMIAADREASGYTPLPTVEEEIASASNINNVQWHK